MSFIAPLKTADQLPYELVSVHTFVEFCLLIFLEVEVLAS